MNNKHFYYKFWLKSSGQTDVVKIVSYPKKPLTIELKENLESWCQTHGAWTIAERVSYGFEPVVRLPKNRKECLKRYEKVCQVVHKAKEHQRVLAGLLGLTPFDNE